MKPLKTALSVLVLFLVVAALLPLAIPTSSYIPKIQELAGEKLGEPVTVAELGVSLLPLPSATLKGIAIGEGQAIRVGSITVRPDVFSLLSETKVIRDIELEGLEVNQALLQRIPLWAKPAPGPKTVAVRQVALRDVRLALDAVKWGPLRAEVMLAEAGLESVDLGTEDGSLRLALRPDQERFRLKLEGRGFTLPIKPALAFDELDAEGVLTKTGLEVSGLRGRLYGGGLMASARLDWEGGWRLKGQARTTGVEISKVLAALGRPASISGGLHAAGSYAMAARQAGQLPDSLRANFRFEVKNGVLHNVDLARAARSFSKEGMRGGQTRFDELTGTVQVAGKGYRLREGRVGSGLLKANGNLDVSPAKALKGKVNVELKGTASLVAVPLEVAGTVQDPILFPDRAALAGAAAGTALLGPGFGTAVGSKAGQALENLLK